MTQNRKRGRSFQDETEFMPLSKRINNLHINNGMFVDASASLNTVEWGPGPPNVSNQLPDSPNSTQSIEWNSSSQYSPTLNESQNPHYFTINKLLFEMYLERIQRGCH